MESIFSNIRSKNPKGIYEYNILIDGCWKCVSSGKRFDVTNPATGEVVGTVPSCNEADVLQAVESAKQGLNEKDFEPVQRLEVMDKARDILLENQKEVAEMITLESGKAISVSNGEVKSTAERLKLTMEEARVLYGEYLPGEWVEDTKSKFAIVLRKPLGIVAAISPFNYPLFLAASKIIPALLAGNTVIAKPASDTPISLIMFACILEKAGLPKGALQIITGRGSSIGDAIITNPDISAISFTGSTGVGETIPPKAGIKKLHLELGGKASAIILQDADIKLAASQICRGVFRNSGQRCDAVSRVLVEKPVKEELISQILKESEKYKTGDPMNPDTQVGTVINQQALERIHGLVEDALAKGAVLLKGGTFKGLFYEPTVLDNVTSDMRIAWEEIFGPVLPVITVKDCDEAVKMSNASEFGLDSCLFTRDLSLALKIAGELQDGSVTINSAPAHGVGHFPFGGNKKSGLGREGIKYSIDELTKLHTIIISENI